MTINGRLKQAEEFTNQVIKWSKGAKSSLEGQKRLTQQLQDCLEALEARFFELEGSVQRLEDMSIDGGHEANEAEIVSEGDVPARRRRKKDSRLAASGPVQ